MDLSTYTHGILGPSVSSQWPFESLQSGQGVQQIDPSAVDSSGSMPSSKGHMVISSSGQGTMSPIASSLRPLVISLSIQVSLRHWLSFQEAGGPCLSSHSHGDLIENLRYSLSTPVTLGSSISAPIDLRVSLPLPFCLRPPLSTQVVLGTLTSAQGAMKLSPAS